MNGPSTRRRADLAAAIAGMTPRDRMVLALMLIEGLSTSEAADVLGEPSRRIARDYRSLLAELRRHTRIRPARNAPRIRKAA